MVSGATAGQGGQVLPDLRRRANGSTVPAYGDAMSGMLFFALLSWVVGVFVLYWVIRLAVKHGIADADQERTRIRRWAREIENGEQPSDS